MPHNRAHIGGSLEEEREGAEKAAKRKREKLRKKEREKEKRKGWEVSKAHLFKRSIAMCLVVVAQVVS